MKHTLLIAGVVVCLTTVLTQASEVLPPISERFAAPASAEVGRQGQRSR